MITCLYCGNNATTIYYSGIRDRLGVSRDDWSFVRCSECGSLNLTPRPSPEQLPSFYPATYSLAKAGQKGITNKYLARLGHIFVYDRVYYRQLRWVLRTVNCRTSTIRILDVGCGVGHQLRILKTWGFDPIGVDTDEEAVRYANDALKVTAYVGDITTCADIFGSNHFDVITAFHVVEHLLDPVSFFKICRELVRPGGVVAGALPVCDGTVARTLGRYWVALTEAPRHIGIPSHRGLIQALEATGLTVQEIARESVVNVAGSVAISISPRGSTSVGSKLGLRHIFSGILMLTALPLVAFTEIFGKPSIVLFAATKSYV